MKRITHEYLNTAILITLIGIFITLIGCGETHSPLEVVEEEPTEQVAAAPTSPYLLDAIDQILMAVHVDLDREGLDPDKELVGIPYNSDGFYWQKYVVNRPNHNGRLPISVLDAADSVGIAKFDMDGKFIESFEYHDNTLVDHYKIRMQTFHGVYDDICMFQSVSRTIFRVNINLIRWNMRTGERGEIANHLYKGRSGRETLWIKNSDKIFMIGKIIYVKYARQSWESFVEGNPAGQWNLERLRVSYDKIYPYEPHTYYAYDIVAEEWVPDRNLTIQDKFSPINDALIQ